MSGPVMPAPVLPAASPAAVSTVETDTYCAACGFNLHTQPVWKDERLAILLARCPECGTHHPAGTRTTAPNAWLGRFAFFGLVIWVMLVLATLLAIFLGLFGTQMAAVEELVETGFEARDGRAVDFNYQVPSTQPGAVVSRWEVVADKTPIDEAEILRVYRLPSWATGREASDHRFGYNRAIPWLPFLIMTAVFTFGTLLAATLLAVTSWFWPARRRYLWLILPLLAGVLSFAVTLSQDDRFYYGGSAGIVRYGTRLDLYMIAVICVLQMLVLAVGLKAGRGIARGILRLVLPPKARQYFGFLWLCDGKTPPLKP